VTRLLLPGRTPAGTVSGLIAAGYEVTEVAFTTRVALPLDEVRQALAEPWDWVVVTSSATAPALAQVGLPAALRVAAVGSATANSLVECGIEVALVADPGGGSALVAAFPPGPGRVLLPGAAEPSAEPGRGLGERGWTVRHVAVYRTEPVAIAPGVLADWQAGRFDAFVVTAGSVARAAVRAAGLPGPPVVALGEPSAAAARACGLVVAAIAGRPDAPGLLAAIDDLRRPSLPPAGRPGDPRP